MTGWCSTSLGILIFKRANRAALTDLLRLYTSLYPESDAARQSELRKCLRQNLACPAIDSVHLFLEEIELDPDLGPTVRSRRINHRPTYRDFFEWCNENRASNDDISVVANSDIYFDEDLIQLARSLTPDRCAALARWNVRSSGRAVLFDRNDSQDSWVFRGPIRHLQCEFPVGVPRCDNRLLYELKQAGYEVVNPAFSVRSYHLHNGQRDEYEQEQLSEFVEPPYAYLWPHNLYSLPRTVLHNLRHPRRRVTWRFDRRWAESTLPARGLRKLARATRGAS